MPGLLLLLPLFSPQGVEPAQTPLGMEPAPLNLALVDLDGDGRKEQLQVSEGLLKLESFGQEPIVGTIPGSATIWTVVDHDGDGRAELLALVDGDSLVRLSLIDGRLAWSEPLLTGLGGSLPRGVRPATFARDLNGDGRADLVVPDGGRLKLYFGAPEGFEAGPDLGVVSRLELQTRSRNHGLLDTVSRELFVPRIGMRDLNGDARPDLQVSEALQIRQYISGEEGLPSEPTVTIDLEEFEKKLPEIRFDPSNIAGLSKYAVFEEWGDLNQDGSLDLILLWGGNVLIYLGGPQGIDLRRPFDQLPTRGNVFYAFAGHVDDDPTPDLVLLRIEDISLARALTWFLLDFSVELDILAYKGLGNGRFERRPLKQSKSLKIDSPSIKNLLDNKNEGDSLRRTIVRLADFDGDGKRNDLAILTDLGELTGWRDVVSDATILDRVTEIFLADLLRGQTVLEIDVKKVTGWLLGRASLLIGLTDDKAPFFRLPPPPGWAVPQAMTVLDADGDGRDEVLMVRRTPHVPGAANGGLPMLVGRLVDPDGPPPRK